MVDPEGPLRRVSVAGELLQSLVPEPPPKPRASHPIALLERGDALWVADREGWLRRLDRDSGRLLGESALPRDQGMRAMVVDLVPGPPGGPAVLAVDALSAAVLSLDEAGEVVGRAGRYGRWAGTLDHPKSAVALQGGALIVADSSLDALQLFWPGEPGGFGLLADADAPLRPDHPLALRPGPDADTVLVLSASSAGARLQVLALAPASLEAAREQASLRRLRTQLGQEHPVASPEGCGQCHDGLVQDGRAALDPAGIHHPVGAVADPAAGLPLDGDDQLQCATCHTAHGDPASGGFLREGLTDDALCVRCHAEDPHREAQAAQGGGRGHKSGAALRAALAARGEGAGAGCLACHSPHAASGPKLARGDEAAGACLGCHPDQVGGDGDHPIGLATTASPGSAPACAHCHQLVGGVGKSLLKSPESGQCSGCHGQSQAVARGGHAALGKKAQGPCLSCHSPHDAARPDLLQALLKSSAADPAGCAQCHAGVGSAGHPLGPTQDGIHPSLTCESCHDVHDPSETPSCASCHAEPAAAGGHGQGPGAPQCLTCHPAHRSAPMDRASGREPSPRCGLLVLPCAGAGQRRRAHRGGVDPPPTPVCGGYGAVVCPLGLAPL